MSWLPAMIFMHMLDDDEPDLLQNPPYPVEQYSTRCNAGDTPITNNNQSTTTDNTPAAANSINNTRRTPTVATRTWHHTAMSSAAFALSAILAYIATEAIVKRIRGRN